MTILSAALLLGAGCGDDSDDTGSNPTPSESVDDAGSNDDGASLGDREITALTDQEICDGLSGAEVGAALGLDVTETAVGGSSTAQCVYNYESESGVTSNVSVASLASDIDLSGRTGDEAFDYVVGLNRGLAGGTDFDEVEPDAGDRAVRFSGEALHLGVLAVDGHILTVLVPAEDTDGDAVDDLLVAMADRFGG